MLYLRIHPYQVEDSETKYTTYLLLKQYSVQIPNPDSGFTLPPASLYP